MKQAAFVISITVSALLFRESMDQDTLGGCLLLIASGAVIQWLATSFHDRHFIEREKEDAK